MDGKKMFGYAMKKNWFCGDRTNVIQFHVDNLSSAHVYLRLQEGEEWDSIPEEILIDCAQLTKANSIEGNKRDNITVIYTPWSNLRKTKGMVTGQVGFKKDKLVKKVYIETRENPIVNRLNKTKKEEFPNLQKLKLDHVRKVTDVEKSKQKAKEDKNAKLEEERRQLKWQKEHAYDDLFNEDNVRASNNQFRDEDYEDDFW